MVQCVEVQRRDVFQKEVASATESQERGASERDIGCEVWEATSPQEEQLLLKVGDRAGSCCQWDFQSRSLHSGWEHGLKAT